MSQQRRSKHQSGSIGSTSLGSHRSLNGRCETEERGALYLPPCSKYRSCLKAAVNATSYGDRTKPRKTVRFKKILIREYERICGDNPSCSAGPPIGISWNHSVVDELISVEQFENERFLQRLPSSQELVMSRAAREALLSAWGVSKAEMVEAVRRNVKVKNQRRQTANNIGRYDRVEEVLESTTRQMKNSFQFRLLNAAKGGGFGNPKRKRGHKENGGRYSTSSSRSSSSNEESVSNANDLSNNISNRKPDRWELVPPTTRIDVPSRKQTLLSGPELPVIEIKRSPSVESALTDANWSQYVPKGDDEDSCGKEAEEEDGVSEVDMEDFEEEEDFTISNLTNFEEEGDDSTVPTKFLNAFDDFCLKHMQELDESHPKLLRRSEMERPSTHFHPIKMVSPIESHKKGPETTPEPLEPESPRPSPTKDKAMLLHIYVPPQGDARRSTVGRPLPFDY